MFKQIKYFKIVWILLFVIWLSITMFYLELFVGMNGIITNVTTQYNIKSKESLIQNVIDNFDNTAQILPHQMQKVKSFKTIIGIGCIKCGSTYFHDILTQITQYWEKKNNASSNYHFVFKPGEVHYFDRCDKCTFNGYLQLLLESERTNDTLSYKPTWIFGEKTVTYFDNYNTAHLLSFYAHQFDIYFYIVLRNPIKQLWSHLWMRTRGCDPETNKWRIQCWLIRDENYYLQNDNTEDIMLMAQYLDNFLKNQVSKELPILYEIMNQIKIDKNVNNGTNNDINENKIIELLKLRTSDILHYYSHVFVQSCHYVLILLWYHEWNLINNENNDNNNVIEFENRFRIIQSEHLWINWTNTNEHIERLMCWMIGNEMNLDECVKKGMVSNKRRGTTIKANRLLKKKLRSYSPNNVDVLDLEVSTTIKEFYNDSLQRLVWFIDQHPKIMLGNTVFVPWW